MAFKVNFYNIISEDTYDGKRGIARLVYSNLKYELLQIKKYHIKSSKITKIILGKLILLNIYNQPENILNITPTMHEKKSDENFVRIECLKIIEILEKYN